MADGKVTIAVDLDGKKAQGGLNALKNSFSSIGSTFKSVLGANLVGSAITKGVSFLTSGIREMASELNSSQKAWKTFEGNLQAFGRSPEVIKAAKAEMQDFATKTIYSASDMGSTYSQLDAVGTKNVGSLVKAFGGLAASAENPAQAMKSLSTQATQMASKPKIAWMDFKIMMEQAPAGMAAVAKEMGMSTAELVSAVQDGKVKTEDFFDAMNKAGNSDAFQKMATEFKTIDQAIDGAKEGLANKLMPAFEQLNTFGIKAVNAVSGALDKIDFGGMADGLGKFLNGINIEGIVSSVSSGISSLVTKVKTFWTAFSNTGAVSAFYGAIKSIGGALGNIFNSLSSSGVLTTLGTALGNIVKWLSQAASAASNFISSLPSGVIQAITGGLIGLIVGFKAFNFLKSFNPFSLFKKNATTGVDGATSVVKSTSSIIVSIIRSLGKSIAVAARGIGQGIGAAFRGIGQGLAMVNPATIAALAIPILALGAAFALMGMQGQGIATILQAVGGVIVSVGIALGTILNLALQGLAKALVIIAPVLPTIASAFAMLAPLITAAGTAISMIISSFSGLAPVITALGTALSQVITAISSGIAQVATAVTPIVEIISNAFVQVVTVVSQAIVQIIQALAPFIPAISEMVQAVSPVLQAIVGAFTTLVQQISPIIDSITNLFKTLGEQISSILESASGVVESFGTSIRNILDGVAGIFESMGNSAKNAGQGVKLMAQGIKMLVDLKLGDLVATLAATAAGLGTMAEHASGMATLGKGMASLGKGMQQVAMFSSTAGTGLTLFSTAITTLLTTVTTLPALLTTAAAGFTSFTAQAVAGVAGLSAINAPIATFKSQIMTITPSLMMASAGFALFSSQAMIVSTSLSGLSSSFLVVSTALSVLSSGFAQVSSSASAASSQLSNAASTTQVVISAFNSMRSSVQSSMMAILNVIRSVGNQMRAQGRQIGQQTAQNIAQGIQGGVGQASGAMNALMSAVRSAGMAGVGSMRGIGAMIGMGLAQGMLSALGAVTAAANALVAQAERAAQAKAKIHSPSRLFRDNVGRFISQGVAVGITSDAYKVTDAMSNIYDNIEAFRYRPEDIIGVGKSKLSKVVQVKSDLEKEIRAKVEIATEKTNDLVNKALDVAEKAVERPVETYLDGDTLVAKTGDRQKAYQDKQSKVYNRMRGIVE